MSSSKRVFSALSVVIAVLTGVPVKAQTGLDAIDIRPPGASSLYYKIGGGEPYLFAYDRRYHLSLGVGARWSMGNICHGFDPSVTIRNTLRDAERSLYGYIDNVISSIPTLVATWGISKLQEANPGIYDLITKGLVDAKEEYNLNVKSCEAMVQDARNGDNPLDGWVSIGTRDSWYEQSGERDAGRAQSSVDNTAGNSGIIGPGGIPLGGSGWQPPIRTVGDVVGAGYNHLNPSSQDPRIQSLWQHSNDAVDWVTSVVGEKEVRICQHCTPKLSTKVGQGLRTKIKEEREPIARELGTLIGMQSQPRKYELDAISVPGMGLMVTEELIRALREEDNAAQRSLLGSRLATELAVARTLEKALVAMDLIKAGQQEPNVAANGEYQRESRAALTRLQTEVDGILYERNVRQQVIANTASIIMERRENRLSGAEAGHVIDMPAHPRTVPYSSGISTE